MRAGLAELSDDIHQAIAEGVIPQLDVEFLTASLGGVAFSILDEMMEREPLDPEAAAQFATRLFMTVCAATKLTCLGGHYEHSKLILSAIRALPGSLVGKMAGATA